MNQSDNICANCKEQIKEKQCVIVDGKKYHTNHFCCTNCQQSLAGKKFKKSTNGVYCEQCALEQLAPTCFGCNTKITTGYIVVEEKKLHQQCFVCQFCTNPFNDQGYYKEDEKFICQRCLALKKNRICNKCNKLIETLEVYALDNYYHDDCFQCNQCKKNISDQSFLVMDNRPYHYSCVNTSCVVCGDVCDEQYYEVENENICHPTCIDNYNPATHTKAPQAPQNNEATQQQKEKEAQEAALRQKKLEEEEKKRKETEERIIQLKQEEQKRRQEQQQKERIMREAEEQLRISIEKKKEEQRQKEEKRQQELEAQRRMEEEQRMREEEQRRIQEEQQRMMKEEEQRMMQEQKEKQQQQEKLLKEQQEKERKIALQKQKEEEERQRIEQEEQLEREQQRLDQLRMQQQMEQMKLVELEREQARKQAELEKQLKEQEIRKQKEQEELNKQKQEDDQKQEQQPVRSNSKYQLKTMGQQDVNTLDPSTLNPDRSRFPYSELIKNPPPEGVIPSKKELYLSDAEFEKIFKMKLKRFLALKEVKRTQLKKQNKLF